MSSYPLNLSGKKKRKSHKQGVKESGRYVVKRPRGGGRKGKIPQKIVVKQIGRGWEDGRRAVKFG